MPVISKSNVGFQGGYFLRVMKVDSKGNFSCNLPGPVAQHLGIADAIGNTKDACEKEYKRIVTEYENATKKERTVIIFDYRSHDTGSRMGRSGGFVWIGVHFGSRGLGHKSTTHFLKKLGAKDYMDADPCLVDMQSDVGQNYFEAMTLAGKYAYAGREWVCKTVAEIIHGRSEFLDVVHNHHNFAWIEEHDGAKYFVVRKGSTPAFPGQRSFIGSSMRDISVIVQGRDTPEAKENLYSTVHGAGRVMSRTQAAGKFKGWGPKKVRVSPGLIDEREMRAEMAFNGVHLFGAGADEAPQCYKNLSEVLAFHRDSVDIVEYLTPIVVCMAGEDTPDPFKD